MTQSNLQILMYLSFFIAVILGVFILIWWYKKVAKRLNKSVEKSKTVNRIAFKSLLYNSPALFVFTLLFIPSLYFGGKLKQFKYCGDVIRVNSKSSTGFNFNDSDFLNDCECFDMDELKKYANEK